jgi:hypothetical protein
MVTTAEVFDLHPEYAVKETSRRRAVRSPMEAGVNHRRQTFSSVSVSAEDAAVRTWGLTFAMASSTDRDRMLALQALTGNGRLLDFQPPDVTDAANILSSPTEFTDAEWVAETSDTGIADDATGAPAAVGGTADLLTNAGGASAPAALAQLQRFFVRASLTQVLSCYAARPGSSQSSYFTLNIREPGAAAATMGNHSVTWNWTGSAWSQSATAGSATGSVALISGPWYRFQTTYTAGDGGTARPDDWANANDDMREVVVQSGTIANPEAGLGILVAGAMLEEFVLTASAFTAANPRVPVCIVTDPLSISRVGPNQYAWEVALEEALNGS